MNRSDHSDTGPKDTGPKDAGHNDTAGVITHPPFIYAGALLFGLGADRLIGLPDLPMPGAPLDLAIVGVLSVVGGALLFAAAARFIKAGTNIPTHRPTTALVTDGLYRFSRNPIYLGLTLIYLAITLGFASLAALILLPVVLAVMQVGVIQREERYLEDKFGEAYRAYKARVRRWI